LALYTKIWQLFGNIAVVYKNGGLLGQSENQKLNLLFHDDGIHPLSVVSVA